MPSRQPRGLFVSFAKNLKENPPEVGDLVHIFGDEKGQAYHLNFHKSDMNPNALQAVPLGIVTKASTPWPHEYADDCDRLDDPEPDDHLVAVRRLTDGDLGVHSELYQEDQLIPIGLFPKLSGDAIPE